MDTLGPRSIASVVAALVVASLILSATAAPAATIVTRTETKEYIAVGGVLGTRCDFVGSGRNLGGTCFQVDSIDMWADFLVTDEIHSNVYVNYSWRTSNGSIIAVGSACGTALNLTIPNGAASLVINIPQIIAQCSGLDSRGVKGSITASFSHFVP